MMGRQHVVVGAGAWLLVAPSLAVSIPQAIAGTLVAGGAGLLPDVDHPDATIAHTWEPVSVWLAEAVQAIAGKHRSVTHSLAFTLAVTAACAASAARWPLPTVAAVTAVCGAWVLRLHGPRQLRADRPTAAIAATVAACVVAALVPAGPWLPAAVGIGCASHLAADLVTPGPIPVLWPLPGRWSFACLPTGRKAEQALTHALTLVVAVLAARLIGATA